MGSRQPDENLRKMPVTRLEESKPWLPGRASAASRRAPHTAWASPLLRTKRMLQRLVEWFLAISETASAGYLDFSVALD